MEKAGRRLRTASGGQGGFAGTSLWQAEGRTCEHPGRARAPIAAAPLHLMACDVPVVSQPVPVVHVPDATVAAHGEPVSVAEAAEWSGITVDAF